jgi:ABC-type polysaccharide/polyol phosphate transport system ATPase subunit
MTDTAISVQNVTKEFNHCRCKNQTIKDWVVYRRKYSKTSKRTVLKDISFEVQKGETFGIIGRNGSGKSTLLKLLSKIMDPTSGSIHLNGRVSSLIELGAGFHPEMSGRENIFINAAIHGLSPKEVKSKLQKIIDFSELWDYIDEPIRVYSSGMYMRLAFSIAINIDADILLIDEILAVGDAEFQKKCFEKINELRKEGVTIVLVSHSMEQIMESCNRAIWIDDGIIKSSGDPVSVCQAYYSSFS